MVVLISGKQGSGKDTLVNNVTHMLGDTYKIKHIKFAQVIYEMHDAVREVGDKYGVARVEPKDGRLLQLLGLEWGRQTKGEDVWVNAFKHRVKELEKDNDIILCSDCRFRNEFDAFPAALKVRLEASRKIRKARCSQWRDTDNHPSETDLDQYVDTNMFDIILHTEDIDESNSAIALSESIEMRMK